MSLCQYKDIFGKVGEGVHSYRIFNLAIVDILGTVLIATVIYFLTNWNFWCILGTLFLLGIVMHRIFCVKTTIDKLLT